MNAYVPSSDPFKILEEIGNWKKSYSIVIETKADHGPDHKILSIIDAFEKFCKEYIAYISEINTPEKGEEPQQELSPDWLDNQINYGLLDYWEPILKAAEQHQVAHYRSLLDVGYSRLADYRDSINSWLKFDLSDQIILYFDKTGKYKRYPFGGIFIIGVPLMDAYRGDWMALPHEVGHHIFWNSQVANPQTSQTRLPSDENQSTDWSGFFDQEIEKVLSPLLGNNSKERRYVRTRLEVWSEEIFADIVGVKIAGEPFVEAAWDKISKGIETPKELFIDDNDHPIPFLRPFIRDIAFGREIDKSRWINLFPGFSNPNELQNDNLQTSLGKFVAGINTKLDDLRIIKEESESTMGRVKGTFKERHPLISTRSDKNNLVKVLLNLYVHEEGEDWTCSRCGTANSWWSLWCTRCGKSRWS